MADDIRVAAYREQTKEGKLILNLHPGQAKAWTSTARFVVILAGTQWGKTCFEPDWLNREIQIKGEGDYLAGTATYPLLELKMLPEFTTLFCDVLHWGKYRDSDKMIISRDEKSRIIFFSGVNPEAVESATAKAAVLDEAGQKQFRLGTWEALQRRLTLNLGRALFGTTLYQLGWLKTEVYDRWKNGDQTFDIIQSDSTENPIFPRDEYQRMKKLLPAWKFDMFYRGRYAKPVGLVYDKFDDTACVIDRFPIPLEWPVYIGHDFGQANPAAIFFAQNPAGEYIAFEEYLPGESKSIYEHVQAFKRITAGRNVITRAGGNWTSEEEIRQGYAAHGWPIQKPIWREPEKQVQNVYELHAEGRIKVFRDLSHYIDQKLTFSYKLNEKYESTDEWENESDYHLLAAERYILCGRHSATAVNGRMKTRTIDSYM